MVVYLLYGQRVAISGYLGISLDNSFDSSNLCYFVEPNRLVENPPGDLVYTSRFRNPKFGDLPAIQIWRDAVALRVQIAASGVYELRRDSIRYFPYVHAEPETQRITLLGTIMSLWLEWMGSLTLHASAVVVDGQAVGFLSNSQAGKTTLAAAFVHAGFPFLTDDILAVSLDGNSPMAQLSYPWMKLWPEQAAHFLRGEEEQIPVHPSTEKHLVRIGPGGFGHYCAEPAPLARLYIPERREALQQGAKVDIFTIPPQQAVIELMRYSFSGPLLHAIGVETERLSKLAMLAQQVPLKRVIYPAGFEHLQLVRDAIVEDAQHT